MRLELGQRALEALMTGDDWDEIIHRALESDIRELSTF
jgi:hypothetical protein